jgi:aspartyl-tRNA(Asn)/glutamyl-tRNA(Gln) amidotransferase subunit C
MMRCVQNPDMDKKELEITAELAHIELSEGEIDRFSQAVAQMIEYFALMDELELDTQSTEHHIPNSKNALREDRSEESSLADDILEQSPDLEDRFISIPNVL